ncbi:hypothetical protein [Undibacterium flavidum]|nr:hypothetical protein [Undibacterium flavidum]
MLSACGGNFNDKLGEILNESKILSVNITPNPIPKPNVNTPTPFSIKVKVDITSVFDVITVNLKNPANSDQYSLLAYPSPCMTSSSACGVTTYEILCDSYIAENNSTLRTLSCGDMKRAVTLPPGTHPMLLEVRHLDILGGFSKFADDSTTVNLLIQ